MEIFCVRTSRTTIGSLYELNPNSVKENIQLFRAFLGLFALKNPEIGLRFVSIHRALIDCDEQLKKINLICVSAKMGSELHRRQQKGKCSPSKQPVETVQHK